MAQIHFGASATYDCLIEVLKTENNYVSDEGNVKKWVVAEHARKYNPELLKMLLDNEKLRTVFFAKVGDATVFLLEKFLQFIEQKNYLEDSYTRFSQKIGLQIGGKFLSQHNEVELVFPYKDCVLEGGQTKDDQKRKEIFFNEVLAQDEITHMLEPKVLTVATQIDANGEKSLDHFNRDAEINEKRKFPKNTITDNLLVKGNNLLSLYTLQKEFRGKVKLIYIDPPYYFRNSPATDTFKYNSTFHLSTWLVFMRDRLKVAKTLLMQGGTIWISIGEDGMHYLKVIADEIFGCEHFVGTLPRRTRSGKSDVPFNMSQDFDWVLVYTNVSDKEDIMGRTVERTYYTTDDYPGKPWRLADLTSQQPASKRPNSYFTMVNPKDGKEYPANEKRTWAVTKFTFEYYHKKGFIVFPGDYDFLNITKPSARKFKYEDDEKSGLSAVISDFLIQDFLKALLNDCKNKKGNDEIDSLFGRDEFDYAKPENLIKSILEVATNENDIVMDFFSGSGTTAAVAHKMGRQYIVCEQINHQVGLNIQRLKEVIEGEQGGISQEVEWQGGGSFVYMELKRYNQAFIDEIEVAETTDALLAIWEKMKQRAYFRFSVDMKAFEKEIKEFKALTIDEQKAALCNILDMNQLYVNASEMNDEAVGVTDEEKAITNDFYGKK